MSTLIFDLDGTLIDTTAIFIPAVRTTLEAFDAPDQPSDDAIRKTYGMTDAQFWDTLLPGTSDTQRQRASHLRNSYVERSVAGADLLLPHAREVLRELKSRGHILTVASNCGTTYLTSVLASQGILDLFTNPLCIESVQGRVKADILSAHFEVFPKTDAYMIGDRASDIEAAHAHSIPAVGCIFGFGNDEELAGADYMIHALPELLEMFGA